MKKNCLFIILVVFIFGSLAAQDEIASFENHLKINSTDIKDVIPIINSENNELTIFMADAKNVYGYKLDKQFKVSGTVSSIRKRRKYKVLLGSSIHGNNYKIYLANKDKNKFATIDFSFDTKNNTIHEFILPSGQKFLQTVSYKNKLYIVSGDKINKTILLSYFDNDKTLQFHNIDVADVTFFNKNDKRVWATDLLFPFNSMPIKKIEKDTPNAIETVSENTKIYLRNNEVIISFDQNKDLTQILTINMDTKMATKNTFEKPFSSRSTGKKSARKKTNSFIYDDKIILIAATKEIFSMQILDYASKKLLKEYTVRKNEEITFKNSPIIQKGGFYNNHRELEKTKQFLRKISTQKIGVSVIKNKNNFHFSIGGCVEQKTSAPMMMGGFGGIPMASFGNVSVFFNPTMLAYNSYTNTKSTQIECLFNEKLEHVKNTKPLRNIFNKMKSYPKKGKTGITVFKYNDYFIRGSYNSFSKTYYLTKFEK